MRIASHHIKGTPESRLHGALGREVDYTPVCAWPDDCAVQWGNGIIPATPFFEAFPPGTFIRGEGETIDAAERDAFAQYERESICKHLWGRRSAKRGTYLNGAGWCRKCDAFRSSMFRSVVVLGHWRKPLSRMERDHLISLETDHEMNEHMARVYPQDEPRRRNSQRVLRIRHNLFGVDEDSSRLGLFAPAASAACAGIERP
jgi:hypothetical protein